jgi:hypothetical protein
MRDKFLYLEQFLTALEDLEPEDRYRATYVLCYWGLYREFPPEATGVDKMYVKTNAKLFEGQDSYVAAQKEKGTKGGRPSEVTDEQIWGAYKELYEKKNGGYPTEQEVIAYLGANVKRIATRNAWKTRNEHLYESMKQVSNKDTYNTNTDGFHGF